MFNNKVFLVTGANGAVASSIVAKFYQAQATLVLLERQAGQKTIQADLTKLEEAQIAVAKVIQTHGRLDGVIHTVGGFTMQGILEYKPETYQQMLEVNLHTTVNIAAAAMPELIKTGGFFGAIAAGQVLNGGGKNVALYSAAKAAMVLFMKSLALEVKAVRFGIVYPLGAIDTPANRRDMPNADPSTFIAPNELAEAFVYMASRSSGGRVQEIQVQPN